MAKCSQCGYINREGNRHCVNCGSILKITEEYLKSEETKQTTAIKKYFAYFFIIVGLCPLFGGLMTYATSVGTIIERITAQVATPYIAIGFILMFVGFVIFMVRTEEQHQNYSQMGNISEQRGLTDFIEEGKSREPASCGNCAYFRKPVLCRMNESNPQAEPCLNYVSRSQIATGS